MIEATVLLTMPLRGVMLTDASASPPEWLELELRRVVEAHQKSAVEAQAAAEIQQELAQLRAERIAWARGLVELKQVSAQLDGKLAAILGEVRTATVDLAHAIASKLVFQQVMSNTFPIERLVTEVLSRLTNHEPATVRLHPADLAALRQDNPNHPLEAADQERTVKLVADPTLSRGDCKAIAGEITVVYELRRQIEEIRAELLSTVSGHAEPEH